MTRWFSKRWVWAALVGATVTVGIAAARGDGPPKAGAVISLNVDGKGERQFKVIKSEKQPDGTYLSELKDTQSGETITLVDKPGDTPPASSGPPGTPASPKGAPKSPEPAKSKPTSPAAATMPDAPKDKEKEKEKRPILGRIFGDRDKDKGPPPGMPNTASSTPKGDAPADSGKKPGLIGRIFGPKKPTGPSMPAASGSLPPGMPNTGKPSASAPPAVIPTPPGGFSGGVTPPPVASPPVATPPAPMPTLPNGTPLPPFPSTTPEPPRVMPGTKPVTPPPAPAVPAPSVPAPTVPAPTVPSTPAFTPPPLPSPTPTPPPPVSVPTPVPTPAPAVPAPLPVPSIPPVPGGSGIPPIPVPPGGVSSAKPIQVVVPAGYVPAGVAFDREVQPFVVALQTMAAPSARLTAAKGLADGRHRSTDGVKAVLFQAAQLDPCGEVRAACITHLCDLGYFNLNFLGFIQTACDDTDSYVREAAKNACAKMIRQKE